MLSDEQMRNIWPFSLLNDEQMSNKVRVEHQSENHLCCKLVECLSPKNGVKTKLNIYNWYSKQPVLNGCLLISNHFPSKDLESSS